MHRWRGIAVLRSPASEGVSTRHVVNNQTGVAPSDDLPAATNLPARLVLSDFTREDDGETAPDGKTT